MFLATWKVLVSLAVVPLLYLSYYAFPLHRHLVQVRQSFPVWSHYAPLIVFMVLPSLGYSALKFGEAGMDVAKWVTRVQG